MTTTTLTPASEQPTTTRLLRRASRTPCGSALTARKAGRGWVILDIDRWPASSFTPAAHQAGQTLAGPLSWLYVYDRNTTATSSGFHSTGTLHAPAASADALLLVLLALDAGDAGPAQRITPAIAGTVEALLALPGHSARCRAARALVDPVSATISALLGRAA